MLLCAGNGRGIKMGAREVSRVPGARAAWTLPSPAGHGGCKKDSNRRAARPLPGHTGRGILDGWARSRIRRGGYAALLFAFGCTGGVGMLIVRVISSSDIL